MKFVREKAVEAEGRYKDINIYQLTTEQNAFSRKRTRKRLSAPKQVKQDWKYARQYATQFVNCNFGAGDLLVDLTYEEEPESREQAERDVYNYVMRLKTLYKRFGVPFRSFWVTGGGHLKKNGELSRFHHHMIISGGVDRDLIEAAWNYKDINRLSPDSSKKELLYMADRYGNKNRVKTSAVKIKSSEFGLEPRVKYMVKPAHCAEKLNAKRWHTCNMSKKPIETRNDSRYSERDVAKLLKHIRDGQAKTYIEKLYKGWELLEEPENSEFCGAQYLRFKLRRKTQDKRRKPPDVQ